MLLSLQQIASVEAADQLHAARQTARETATVAPRDITFRLGRSIPVGPGSAPVFCCCPDTLLCQLECLDHGSGRRGASANAPRRRHD
jgi:hypothetical protein